MKQTTYLSVSINVSVPDQVSVQKLFHMIIIWVNHSNLAEACLPEASDYKHGMGNMFYKIGNNGASMSDARKDCRLVPSADVIEPKTSQESLLAKLTQSEPTSSLKNYQKCIAPLLKYSSRSWTL